MPSNSTDPVYKMHRSFLHLAYLYIDLREAQQIVRHWKLWLPHFLAEGFTNYATEAIHVISNLTALFPKHIAYIATHNRTINMTGRPGRAKPIDQFQLLHNYLLYTCTQCRIFKQTLRTSGGNLTHQHVEDVSLAVLFLMEAAKRVDTVLGVSRQSTAHTVRDAGKDILKMATDLSERKTTEEVPSRTSPVLADNSDVGWKKLTTTSWLKDVLSKKLQQDETDTTIDLEERGVENDYKISDVV